MDICSILLDQSLLLHQKWIEF